MVARLLLAVVVLVLNLLGSCSALAKLATQKKQYAIQSTIYSQDLDTKVCRTVPGLTKAQMGLCYQQPDTFVVALEGLNEAVKECQHQFHGHRWNCSSLSTKSQNPYISAIFQRGYKESAFASAIASAGVAIAVARSCSSGLLSNCGCDPRPYKMRRPRQAANGRTAWKWGGCSHNLRYGIKYSKQFLDARERAEDIHSRITLHNNQVGRLAVSNNMQVKCKCHGMSGSCELKTCWRAAPDFRFVGKTLKERFRSAILVDQNNLGDKSLRSLNVINQKKRRKNKQKQWTFRRNKNKRDLSYDLLYYQKSPTYCDRDQSLDVSGTTGRHCNRTGVGSDSCSNLCCGRGYNTIMDRRDEMCNCKFRWCCEVKCDTCNVEEWISVCK
ncbi:protein Wnt-10a [Aethina tumida]|uniref:protein Wnt-10a n=1 Tax=Aethina tumida TaxID=116153 RepID=UPI00096B0E1A|nr:protein Wnt-10a [Aethina tumida]